MCVQLLMPSRIQEYSPATDLCLCVDAGLDGGDVL